MTLLLSLIFISNVVVAAPSGQIGQSDAYNLHQALNFMSVYASGRCKSAIQLAKQHLAEIKAKPSEKPFGEIATSLRQFKTPSAKDITGLELLRMKFGEALEAHAIEHKMAWHREIEAACPNAPHVE